MHGFIERAIDGEIVKRRAFGFDIGVELRVASVLQEAVEGVAERGELHARDAFIFHQFALAQFLDLALDPILGAGIRASSRRRGR